MASKVLVAGAVYGQFQPAFSKIATLHAKNNFTFAILTGDLFASDDDAVTDLLEGRITVPLPTYFTIGLNPFPERVIEILKQDKDICENLHYLGKRSTTNTASGLRIVALGGQLDESIIAGPSQEDYLPFHTIGDAKSLKGAKKADILLTASWPASIRSGSKVPLPEGGVEPKGYEHIAELVTALKPRYHLTSSPTFYYEREPFFQAPSPDAKEYIPVTRFISFAAFGNAGKQKAFYALSLKTVPDVAAPLPANATRSPFPVGAAAGQKRDRDAGGYQRYAEDSNGYRRQKRRGPKGPLPGPESCFFCLSNPNLATHLVVSIADEVYCTTAKGPLTTSTTNAEAGISFPCHILIIPLSHQPTLALVEAETRQATYAQMIEYKRALQSMVAARSNDKLGAVTYEISRAGGVHTHWQFLPVPATMIRQGLVEAAFKVEGENARYPLFQTKDPGLGEKEGDFFRAWIWAPGADDGEEVSKCITMPIDENGRFDLQFGRRVLAKLLGLEKRLQWRDCAQTVQEEEAEAQAFKEAFKIFDPAETDGN